MYQPVVNPRTKKEIFPGLAYGSELGWATFGGQQPFGIATQMFQYMVFNNPNWDYKTLNFDSDMALVDKAEAGLINARDPEPQDVHGARRQADSVSRLGRPADSRAEQHASTTRACVETMGGAAR